MTAGNVKCSQHMQINRHSSALYLCDCLAAEGGAAEWPQVQGNHTRSHIHTHTLLLTHIGSKCGLSVAKRRGEYVSTVRLK